MDERGKEAFDFEKKKKEPKKEKQNTTTTSTFFRRRDFFWDAFFLLELSFYCALRGKRREPNLLLLLPESCEIP